MHAADELYGSDRCLLEIVRGLPAGYRSIIVLPADVPHPGPLTRALEEAGATVHHRRMLVLRRGNLGVRALPTAMLSVISGTLTLVRLIRRERVTLVHSNTVAVVCGAFAAAVTKRPHLWHVHEFLGDEPLRFRVPLRLMLRLLPGAVVANSRATARATNVPDAQIIENALFLPVGAVPSTGATARPVTIGYVGRLAPRKGVAEALQAVASLARRGIEFRFLIAGGPPPGQPELRQEYEALAEQLGISEATTFTGETDTPETIYAQIDILLVPSQRPEPFGLTIVEGMAAGCAVVATRNGGGSDEILEDGQTGVYCGRDPGSIAGALERLINDPQLRQRIADSGQKVASSRFNSEGYVASFVQTYSRLGA